MKPSQEGVGRKLGDDRQQYRGGRRHFWLEGVKMKIAAIRRGKRGGGGCLMLFGLRRGGEGRDL
jgi:hypothetical protein